MEDNIRNDFKETRGGLLWTR